MEDGGWIKKGEVCMYVIFTAQHAREVCDVNHDMKWGGQKVSLEPNVKAKQNESLPEVIAHRYGP